MRPLRLISIRSGVKTVWISHPVYNGQYADPIQLRDYQEECIQSVLSALGNGHKRVGISLATGSGKTVIFTQLIDRVQPPSEFATQTLIVAHRRELVEQAARHCTRAYPNKTIEIEMGKLHASGTADITIASLQSIVSEDRLAKFDKARFKLVLVDEAHHIVAPGYLKVLAHLGLAHKRADSPALVGVSATFSRFDGLKLGAAIDEIVYHKDYVDMIGDKWLSDVLFTTVETSTDLSKVKRNASGDFQVPSLAKAVNTEQNNDLTVRTWFAKAAGRQSTLVFCVDLSHVASLTQKFRQYGVDARFVTGDTPDIERSQILDDFRNGVFPVLVNCGVFTEGTDIPNIDCIILGRPTQSRNLLVQMIGRGMRLHPGKKNCHIIDMVSSLETGIVTTPTLFGLDPNELVNETSTEDMRSLKERKEAETQRKDQAYTSTPPAGLDPVPRKVTFTEYDSVFDLISDTSGEKHIRSISQYTWVQVGPDRYILSGPTGTYLRIERAETEGSSNIKFVAWEVRALPAGVSKAPFAAPRELLKSTTLADAVHGCDKYAEEIFPHTFISRKQRWRDGPATDGQLKFLNKIRSEDDQLTAEDISKGKAGDMITKIKHGARGRFASIEADKRRKERRELVLEQAKMRRMNEVVSVGPLSV
ncbi:P-loop containing nucleoside triphosphate hydrolase protein [Coniochaeta ligniaria NRRL 30616]|uniref:p-loop containing nucleoside triphosphate hydrolase protein n=1 Tax=Coniochaeta ligniaria NRRL 30616 TaxID=1408157 RepID=A0A1J7IYX9_9PEZI|nr:P-loop containing nucleoside triphosphate hydrolase protein [Coniochaeta ligniaria NRRL 30616]